ncbi:MAG: preprotein translocase subunit SecG [Betaproteobacteria bacterium]|jgi:preprotein translocase subunit SecG|nr:preprotein translocase subunit SecG [Betaproteobacteria bacterium]
MTFWTQVLIVLHVLVALGIIGLVLLQHGKGADMGSGFGGGASGSLFGATGSANFLSRATAVLAAIFFSLSLALAWVATRKPTEQGGGVIDAIREKQTQQPAKPAAEAAKPGAETQVPADSQKPAADVPKPTEPKNERQVPQ